MEVVTSIRSRVLLLWYHKELLDTNSLKNLSLWEVGLTIHWYSLKGLILQFVPVWFNFGDSVPKFSSDTALVLDFLQLYVNSCEKVWFVQLYVNCLQLFCSIGLIEVKNEICCYLVVILGFRCLSLIHLLLIVCLLVWLLSGGSKKIFPSLFWRL